MRIAVLGTGSIGSRHLAVLRASGATPVAIPVRASRRPELAAEGFICVESLKAARDEGATAAVIATATGRHVSDVESAIALGLHVIAEKPLAVSFRDAAGLPTQAAQRGVRLFVAYCLRFDEGLQAFRRRLPGIGELHSVRIECRSFLPDWRPGRDYKASYSARAGEGGVIADLSHEIDYAVWLFGGVDEIIGLATNRGWLGVEAEEMAEAIWTTASGAHVSMALDYVSRQPTRVVRASGGGGELVYDFLTGVLTAAGPGADVLEERFERRPGAMYEAQARAIIRAMNGEPPGALASVDEALDVLRVCDAWRLSSVSGRREEVR